MVVMVLIFYQSTSSAREAFKSAQFLTFDTFAPIAIKTVFCFKSIHIKMYL